MKRVFIGVVFLSLGLVHTAIGQTVSGSVTNTEAAGNTIALTEEQKQAVIDAAVAAKSRQKTPKEFSPNVGATVPKEVYLHGFKPDETQKTPLLKKYFYAYLDREIVLVDGRKVVALIALPEKLVAGEQPHHGAAEASSTNAKGGTPPTGSVPSHTSPESIK